MPITTTQAQTVIKKLNEDLSSLNPSALVEMFEIDLTSIILNSNTESPDSQKIFRFHNNVKLTTSSIWFQNKEYLAIPIQAEGFEINGKGALPTPRLRLAVSEDLTDSLTLLRQRINDLGDLVGAKVTRKRTLAKYLDARNFDGTDFIVDSSIAYGPQNLSGGQLEFAPDVFYIDRKAQESRSVIEFELASILDVEGVQLPSRLVVSNRCIWQYRGEGCCYEYTTRKNSNIHGSATLPGQAPPVGTENDELITEVLGTPIKSDKGEWKNVITYDKGDFAFIDRDGVKYYFVSKLDGNLGVKPPNSTYWIPDQCSKLTKGCRLRYGNNGAAIGAANGLGFLPFGGFSSVNKLGS